MTGLSGGGKTAAAKLFEDLGYVVVDNLPGELLRDLADLVSDDPPGSPGPRSCSTCGPATSRWRSGRCAARSRVAGSGRWSSSSRPATTSSSAASARPATATRSRTSAASRASIAHERAMLESVRQQADVVLDTCDLALRELRERIFARLGDVRAGPPRDPAHQLRVQVRRAARGRPRARRPVHEEPVLHRALRQLRPHRAGPRVRARSAGRGRFLVFSRSFSTSVPAYVEEGKTRLTIAHRCTGGYHRSIVISEVLADGSASATTAPSPCSIASSNGREAGAAARARVNLRRWLTAGIGIKRWLASRVHRRARARSRRGHVLRQCRRTSSRAGRRADHHVVTLQFLPYALRG